MHADEAVRAWRDELGEARVCCAPELLDRYARSTQAPGTRPVCVLYPISQEEVQAVVRIAAAQGVALYPVSRGKNWGYGDACAPTSSAAIVDLSRMNRILEINRELAYAVLEPGVSQQQLYDALCETAPELWMDATGAGGESSIVGNLLERGFGHTAYADHVQSTCTMDVVLPDASVLRTGFAHYADSAATHVYPYGVGPSLNGLFTQSNLGIITRATVWLCPVPEAYGCFYMVLRDEQALPELIDLLRPLRLRGLLNSAVHIGNDLRVFSSRHGYPWERANHQTPLPPALRVSLREEAGIGAWNLTGALTGSQGGVGAAARALRKALRPVGKVVFIDDRRLGWAQGLARLARRSAAGRLLASKLEMIVPNYGLLKGIPTDTPLRGTYWRLRNPPEHLVDPLETSAGLMWLSPVLPLQGAHAQRVLDIVSPHFQSHGFDLLATLTLLNERSMVAVLNVSFDQSVPGEAETAAACYEASLDALLKAGYPPYRVGPQGMPKLVAAGDPFWEAASAIKNALDPRGIIAPGRYIPQSPENRPGQV